MRAARPRPATSRLLHAWVTHPRSVFWRCRTRRSTTCATSTPASRHDPHHDAWLGRVDGEPAFLVETYDPAHCALAGPTRAAARRPRACTCWSRRPTTAVHGFTSAVLRRRDGVLLRRPGRRPRRGRAGRPQRADRRPRTPRSASCVLREVELPDKTRALSVCTRDDFAATPDVPREPRRLAADRRDRLPTAAPHARRDGRAHRAPGRQGDRGVRPRAAARARARRRRLPARPPARLDLPVPRAAATRSSTGSIDRGLAHAHRRRRAGRRSTRRSSSSSSHDALGIPDRAAAGRTWRRSRARWPARPGSSQHHRRTVGRPACDADFQTIEAAMTEGHPASSPTTAASASGSTTTRRTRPRPVQPVRLVWLAVRRDERTLSLGAGLTRTSSTPPSSAPTRSTTSSSGCATSASTPPTTCYLPVHPWQWEQQARRHVRARRGPPRPRAARRRRPTTTGAQQSIRTFFNRRPARPALREDRRCRSRTWASCAACRPPTWRRTPAINDWVAELVGRRRDAARLRLRGAARARRDRLHRRRLPPHGRHLGRTARCSPRCGARARCPGSADGERLATMAVAAAPRPRRPAAGRRR